MNIPFGRPEDAEVPMSWAKLNRSETVNLVHCRLWPHQGSASESHPRQVGSERMRQSPGKGRVAASGMDAVSLIDDKNYQVSGLFDVVRSGAFDKILERFPFYILHRVKVVITDSAEVEDQGDIRVTNARRRAGFASGGRKRVLPVWQLADSHR